MNEPLTPAAADPERIPCQKPQPRDMVVHDAMSQADPRLRVPLSEHVALQPLQFTRIEKARAHYTASGLGERYVEQFIL